MFAFSSYSTSTSTYASSSTSTSSSYSSSTYASYSTCLHLTHLWGANKLEPWAIGSPNSKTCGIFKMDSTPCVPMHAELICQKRHAYVYKCVQMVRGPRTSLREEKDEQESATLMSTVKRPQPTAPRRRRAMIVGCRMIDTCDAAIHAWEHLAPRMLMISGYFLPSIAQRVGSVGCIRQLRAVGWPYPRSGPLPPQNLQHRQPYL